MKSAHKENHRIHQSGWLMAAAIGGAPPIRGALRVCFWGSFAMGLTAIVGSLFGIAAYRPNQQQYKGRPTSRPGDRNSATKL